MMLKGSVKLPNQDFNILVSGQGSFFMKMFWLFSENRGFY